MQAFRSGRVWTITATDSLIFIFLPPFLFSFQTTLAPLEIALQFRLGTSSKSTNLIINLEEGRIFNSGDSLELRVLNSLVSNNAKLTPGVQYLVE